MLIHFGWFTFIENRIYREELKESLGMNFFSPFQPEKCRHNVNVLKFYTVEYINTLCSLDYPFNFEFLKLLNKLYKMN